MFKKGQMASAWGMREIAVTLLLLAALFAILIAFGGDMIPNLWEDVKSKLAFWRYLWG